MLAHLRRIVRIAESYGVSARIDGDCVVVEIDFGRVFQGEGTEVHHLRTLAETTALFDL